MGRDYRRTHTGRNISAGAGDRRLYRYRRRSDHAPLFPYSGRVIRLIARLGDHVAKGAPLMAVAASEKPA
jgi:hypothetical protein